MSIMRRGIRKSAEKPLKAAIEEFLQTFHLKDKLNETRVVQAWGKVVGEMVAKHTEWAHIKNRILFVKVDSPAVRNELLFARKKLIAALNKEAGSNVIDEIVLS